MPEKVTPLVDIAFKKLFGVEENKDLLISLINSIVSEEDQVLDVELLNPYNPKNFKTDKLSILDIKAKSCTGKYYNIEIQICDEGDYDKRALFYWAKLYTEQLGQNKDYKNLNKTIGIHILNFLSIPDTEKYHNVFALKDTENKIHHFKDMELHTIELGKFENSKKEGLRLSEAEDLKLLLSKVKTSLDRWAAFLSRVDLLSNRKLPKELKDPHVKKALEVLEVMNFNKQERDAYEGHLKWLRAQDSALRKKEAEGRAEGIEIGKQQGIAEGRAEGIAEGIEIGRTEIVKNLLSQGVDVNVIAKSAGLTVKEIEKIKKKIDK